MAAPVATPFAAAVAKGAAPIEIACSRLKQGNQSRINGRNNMTRTRRIGLQIHRNLFGPFDAGSSQVSTDIPGSAGRVGDGGGSRLGRTRALRDEAGPGL